MKLRDQLDEEEIKFLTNAQRQALKEYKEEAQKEWSKKEKKDWSKDSTNWWRFKKKL